jgi:hypothetical protein
MHKFLIYWSVYFYLTCFGLSISPFSEVGDNFGGGWSLLGMVSDPGADTIPGRLVHYVGHYTISYRGFLRQSCVRFFKDLNVQRKCKDGWKRFYLLGRLTAPKESQKEGANTWLLDTIQGLFRPHLFLFPYHDHSFSFFILYSSDTIIWFPYLSVKMWINSYFNYYFHITHTSNSLRTTHCTQCGRSGNAT